MDETICLIKEDRDNELMSNLDLICSLEIFNSVPLSRIAEVLACCVEKKYNAGEIILQEGDEGEKFYIIKSGSV